MQRIDLQSQADISDKTLLRRWSDQNDRTALAELILRHPELIYLIAAQAGGQETADEIIEKLFFEFSGANDRISSIDDLDCDGIFMGGYHSFLER